MSRIGLAIFAVAVAGLLRWFAEPLFGERLPYQTFYLAVALVAWFGGFGPALIASVLGFVVAEAAFVAPHHEMSAAQLRIDALRYFSVAIAFSVLGGLARGARRRAEHRRERLQVTLASIGDAVIATDTAGRIVSMNPVAETLTGWAEADAAGRPLGEVFRIVNETTRATVEDPVARVLASGAVVGLANHTVLIAKDGAERPIDDSAAPIRAAGGELRGVVLVFRDVSERRRAEQALEQAALRQRRLVESISDGFVAMDAQWRFIYANAEAERQSGRSRDQLLGRTWGEAFAPLAGGALEQALRRAMDERLTTALEHRVEHWDRWFAIKAYPVEEGGVAIHSREITEAKRAEESLRRWEHIFMHAAWAMAVVDATSNRFVSVNPAFASMHGYAADELIGQPLASTLAAEEREQLPRHAALAAEHGAHQYESMHLRKDASVFPCLTQVTGFRDASGRVTYRAATFVDLSEIRAAEVALKHSEARKTAMLRTALDAVITIDHEGTVLDWNPAAERLFAIDAASAIGREMAQLIIPERDRDRHRAGLARQLAGGEHRVLNRLLELTAMRADGSDFPVEVAITSIGNEGRPMFTGYLRDISERKRTRERLEQRVAERTAELSRANVFLQALLASIQDGIVACDANGVLTLFNRATREFHGLPQEAIGADEWAAHYDLYAPGGTRPLAKEEIPLFRALSGERVAGQEMVIAPREGARRTLLASGQPFHDESGRLLGAVVSMHDITERKRAEEALQRAHDELEQRVEQRSSQLAEANRRLAAQIAERELAERTALRAAAQLEQISDAVPALISYVDREGRYRLNNRAYEEWFGHKRAEVTGRHMRDVLGEGAWAVIGPRIEAALGGRTVVYEAEVPYKSGGTRWIRATYTPDRGAGGHVAGVVVLVVDISEHKSAEAALRQAARQKDEFLATLAHELRNPLVPLRNGLHLLRSHAGDGIAAERSRQMMERQLTHLVRLVDDLLDVSRISRGVIELRRERVALAAVIDEAVESCRPLVEQRSHALDVALPDAPLWLDADRTRLSQALCNLLVNAAKYTEPGGRVSLSARAEEGWVRVSVQDNGVGIAADVLPRVFDMFTQADRSLESAHGGLGIGLAIVRKLIELHGGTVRAHSDGLGHGSTFEVRLPLADGARADAPPPAAKEKPPVKTRRVLVVDDNADAAQSMAMMLQGMGHETRTAHDGAHAFDVARAFAPEVVFMDIGMPVQNGYDAARRIRAEPWGRTMTLIALTGWGQAADKRQAGEAGFDHHLVKPAQPEQLEALLA